MSCWILCRRGHANCQGCDLLSSAQDECTAFQAASPGIQHCSGPALGAHNQIPHRNWCFGGNLGEDTVGAVWMPAKSIAHSVLLHRAQAPKGWASPFWVG